MQTNAESHLRWHHWCTERPRLGATGSERGPGKLDPGDLAIIAGQRHCTRSTKIASHHGAWEWVCDSCPKFSVACLGIFGSICPAICKATCHRPGRLRTRSSLVCCKLVIQQYRLKTREANWKWSCFYQSKNKSIEMFFWIQPSHVEPKHHGKKTGIVSRFERTEKIEEWGNERSESGARPRLQRQPRNSSTFHITKPRGKTPRAGPPAPSIPP